MGLDSVRASYAHILHLSGKLAKGDPKIRVRNYVHHLVIPGKRGSKEKTLRNPFTQWLGYSGSKNRFNVS